MEEKHNLHQQTENATLARFYDWIKQREEPIPSHVIHQNSATKTDKEKNDVASCSF